MNKNIKLLLIFYRSYAISALLITVFAVVNMFMFGACSFFPLHVERLNQLITQEKKHKGILLTDHYYENVMGLCDQIYLLEDGEIWIAEGREDMKLRGYI